MKSIFKQGQNCWVASSAAYAAPLIDCANYYRALHSSIAKAQRSIYIVGWDIDSRIRLLRGEEEKNSELPSVISDLLAWKAKQCPKIRVHLLRWDSSLAFFSQRELWAKEVWDEKTPDNVKTLLDDTIPMGGSQHQKIVLIDNEIVFSGGMDISTKRWDTRDHPIVSKERVEPDGEYPPLHDVQIVSAGPVVREFAELVHWRWQRVAEEQPQNLHELSHNNAEHRLPASWPEGVVPIFKDVDCALSRTVPFMDDVEPAQEVRRMLLDLINQAEHFIYIENQFTTRQEIAEALNKRLKAKPSLVVLIVSSYEPKGKFECEAFWASRIDFKNIIEKGITPHRVMIACSSITDEEGQTASKRIHSKFMTIDDKYLVVGSSNLSNRSMTLDTEIDLVLYGNTAANREQIAAVRDDLIAEHSGRSKAKIPPLIESATPIAALMENQSSYCYVLKEVNDEKFTDQSAKAFFQSMSDPEEPLIPPLSIPGGNVLPVRNPSRQTMLIALILAALAIIVGVILLIGHSVPWLNTETMNDFLEKSRGTYFALPTVLIIYVVGGFLFFPVTVMSLAVAAIFGPLWGPVYGMLGALLSAAIMFWLGHLLGKTGLKKLGGPKIEAVDAKLGDSGIVGIAVIRTVPIAPYSLVNLVAGISSVGLIQFLVGTFLGMAPPMIAKGLVGDSIAQIFSKPSPATVAYLVGGIVLWLLMIWGSQKIAKVYQQRKQEGQPEADKCAA